MRHWSEELSHRSNPLHGIGHDDGTDGWNLLTGSHNQQTAKSMLSNTKPFQSYTSPKVIYMV